MVNALKTELAIDSPSERSVHRYDAIGNWIEQFEGADFEAEGLPPAFDEKGQAIDLNIEVSKGILSRVGGLVIICYGSHLREFDKSVMVHIDQAAEAEIPLFLQAPYEEMAPEWAGRPPGEVIVTSSLEVISAVQKRLGE